LREENVQHDTFFVPTNLHATGEKATSDLTNWGYLNIPKCRD